MIIWAWMMFLHDVCVHISGFMIVPDICDKIQDWAALQYFIQKTRAAKDYQETPQATYWRGGGGISSPFIHDATCNIVHKGLNSINSNE